MDDVKRILAVSRSTKQCNRVVHYGISLANKYSAELYVVRVIHDPFKSDVWNLPIPTLEEEYNKIRQGALAELDSIITSDAATGITIKELVREGEPFDAISSVIRDENIDLVLMLAHEEGRIEHFLFGHAIENLVRKMPCSIFLLKSEPSF